MTRRLLEHLNHELRSPMTVVVGMTDLLLMSAAEGEQKHLLQSVRQASDGMLRMLDEGVDFSRLEAGLLRLDEGEFALADVTGEAMRVLGAEPASLRLSVSIDPAVPARLVGDADRLRQMLDALTRSAAKLRSRREYELAISAEPSSGGVLLHFALSEHGRPLDAASARSEGECLRFAEFERLGYFGSGLGLPVAAGLAELMGGRLWMSGDAGSPLVFRLTAGFALPGGQSRPDLLAAIEARLAEAPPKVSSLHVLLAEDTAANREFFRLLLEQRGHSVVAVENGDEALRAYQSCERTRPFDLILLDVEMPVLGGCETADALRKLTLFADRPLPLVALTAHRTAGDREFSAGGLFDAAITKPCELAHFYAVIEALSRGETPPTARGAAEEVDAGGERIDYRGTLRRLGGSEPLFFDLRRFFLEDAPAVLAKLGASLDRQEAEGVERAAHSLKGLVANFGAKEASRLAAELQSLGHQRHLQDAAPIYQRLATEVDLLRRELQAYQTGTADV